MWSRFKKRFLKKNNDVDGSRKYKGKKPKSLINENIIPSHNTLRTYSSSSDNSIDKCKLIQLQIIHKRHLIVDDSQTNRYVLCKYLQRYGITVDEAADGLECLDMIKKHPNTYDVIWMDLRMPKMDGIEATHKLRSVLGYTNYIIGLTGHVEIESRKLCFKLGMNYVIPKPIIRNELYSLLFELFKIENPDS